MVDADITLRDRIADALFDTDVWITLAIIWIASMVVIFRITHLLDVASRREDDDDGEA